MIQNVDTFNRAVTVLIRTTGSKNVFLEEALMSLSDQIIQPNEVHLLCHNVKEPELLDLESLVYWARSTLKLNVKLKQIKGGNRGYPLQIGLSESTTDYVCFLDDDDLVLNNWISCFLEQVNEDSIVRTLIANRNVEYFDDKHRHVSSNLIMQYENQFSWLQGFRRNHTPIHGFMLPRKRLSELGINFSESLKVCEDWDLLMRASIYLNVLDTETVTGIYNINSNNQKSGENASTWIATEKHIRSNLSKVLKQAGQSNQLAGHLVCEISRQFAETLNSSENSMLANTKKLAIKKATRSCLHLLSLTYLRNTKVINALIPPGSRPFHYLKLTYSRIDKASQY